MHHIWGTAAKTSVHVVGCVHRVSSLLCTGTVRTPPWVGFVSSLHCRIEYFNWYSYAGLRLEWYRSGYSYSYAVVPLDNLSPLDYKP